MRFFMQECSDNCGHFEVKDNLTQNQVIQHETMTICSNICFTANTGMILGEKGLSECDEIALKYVEKFPCKK